MTAVWVLVGLAAWAAAITFTCLLLAGGHRTTTTDSDTTPDDGWLPAGFRPDLPPTQRHQRALNHR